MIFKILITISTIFILFHTTQSKCPFSQLEKGTCPFSFKESTSSGCECESPCHASKSIGNSQCDFCFTKGNCGQNSKEGKIDFCTFPKNDDYESRTAEQKLSYLWHNCEKDQNIAGEEKGEKLFNMSMHTTFDTHWDVMPRGREKVIRAVGAVCKFSFVTSEDSPFTGVWEANAESMGIIRLSWPPFDKSTGLVPGVGVKFLRSNIHSGNFVAVNSFDPIPDNSFNWFQEPLRNKFPLNKKKAKVINKFREASQCPYFVGLSDICKYTVNGKKIENPKFPFEVELQAAEINFPKTPIDGGELFEQLAGIPIKSAIYDVFAYESPEDKNNGNSIYLGSIITESKCISSAFGDTKLFFRHQRVEEDWALREEWIKHISPRGECNTDKLTSKVLNTCPSKRGGTF